MWLQEKPKRGSLSIRRLMSVPLPTPEGPTMTNAEGAGPPSPGWGAAAAPSAAAGTLSVCPMLKEPRSNGPKRQSWAAEPVSCLHLLCGWCLPVQMPLPRLGRN